MNTSMHGRKISTIGVPGANGELRYYEGDFHLSATHHGDHDQFWVIVMVDGAEVTRYNARHVGHIVWERSKPGAESQELKS